MASRTAVAARATLMSATVGVLLAWPAAAPGATPVRKDFYGDGANRAAFQVINRDGRRAVRFFAIELGSDCAGVPEGIRAGVRLIRVSRTGRFSHTFRAGNLIYQRVSGRFTSPRRASGTFRARSNVEVSCDTGVKRWTAKAVNRRSVRTGTWRGSVTGSSLSFKVFNGGRAVEMIGGTVRSTCTPSASFGLPPTSSSIVAPDGSFRLSLRVGFFGGRFTTSRSAAGTVETVFASTPPCPIAVPWTATR